jgi:MFS family permease
VAPRRLPALNEITLNEIAIIEIASIRAMALSARRIERNVRSDMTRLKQLTLLGGLYLSQGIPLGFFTEGLPVILRERGLSMAAIAATSLLGAPWALKFVVAPWVDRWSTRLRWIVILQCIAVLGLGGAAVLEPRSEGSGLATLFFLVFVINLASATQDIATDALAVDIVPAADRAAVNGLQVAAGRGGLLVGGGLLPVAFSQLGWAWTFVTMALFMASSLIPVLAFGSTHKRPARIAPSVWGAASSFVRRHGLRWLVVLGLYKAGHAVTVMMIPAFLGGRGMSLSDIGLLHGTWGFFGSILGGVAGGFVSGRLARPRALLLCGAVQALAVAACALPALHVGGDFFLACVVISQNVAGAAASAVLFAAMMDRCEPVTAASDFALQASAFALVPLCFVVAAGSVADRYGFAAMFAGAALLGLVGLAGIVRSSRAAPK